MIESSSSAPSDRALSHPSSDAPDTPVCTYLLRYHGGVTVLVDRNARLTDAQPGELHSGQAELMGRSSDGATVVVWTESGTENEGSIP